MGIATGWASVSTRSAKRWAGATADGDAGDGYCARAKSADVRKRTESATANPPPRRRRAWLPAIGQSSSMGIGPPDHSWELPVSQPSPGILRRGVGAIWSAHHLI